MFESKNFLSNSCPELSNQVLSFSACQKTSDKISHHCETDNVRLCQLFFLFPFSYFPRLGIACLSTGTNWELCSFVVQPNLLEEFGPVSVLMRLRAKMMAQSKESPILDALLTMEFLFHPIN